MGRNTAFLLHLLNNNWHMIFTLRLMAIVIMVFAFSSCKNKGNGMPGKNTMHSLTIQLPLESCNYYDTDTVPAINFVLKDYSGKNCVAWLDTITKGGGTVYYDSLTTGNYTYSVNTVFNETITNTIHLTSDSTISLSAGEIYGYAEAISKDSLATTDSIDIILDDTAISNTITIKKNRNKYLVSFSGSTKKEQQQIIIKDSAQMIKALITMKTALFNLDTAQIRNKPFAYKYFPETAFYMKTKYQYMSCTDIDQAYFNTIHRQFIKAIFEKN
jgi:hypothetical protein